MDERITLALTPQSFKFSLVFLIGYTIRFKHLIKKIITGIGKMMKFNSLLAITALSMPMAIQASEMSTLADWMTGSFNSKAQSITNERYYDINLEMVQIWPERSDAIWLYVEQAVSSNMEKPYRQRIYKLENMANDKFISTVYALPEPDKVVGAWQKPESLQSLTPSQLVLRQGCHIHIDTKNESDKVSFVGSTEQKLCTSKLRGATYATSHVDIKADVLTSWDQGFDAKDIQVWGAQEGPYVFDKVKNYPLNN